MRRICRSKEEGIGRTQFWGRWEMTGLGVGGRTKSRGEEPRETIDCRAL